MKQHSSVLPFLAVLAFLLSVPSLSMRGADFSGRVVAVLDGDTIEVMHSGRAERIRIFGIDCPERGQPYGTKARQFTSGLAFGKTVTVIPKDTDEYGRTIARVQLPGGRDLRKELIRTGLAWWYRHYDPGGFVNLVWPL